jgi:hypothetical protein
MVQKLYKTLFIMLNDGDFTITKHEKIQYVRLKDHLFVE